MTTGRGKFCSFLFLTQRQVPSLTAHTSMKESFELYSIAFLSAPSVPHWDPPYKINIVNIGDGVRKGNVQMTQLTSGTASSGNGWRWSSGGTDKSCRQAGCPGPGCLEYPVLGIKNLIPKFLQIPLGFMHLAFLTISPEFLKISYYHSLKGISIPLNYHIKLSNNVVER